MDYLDQYSTGPSVFDRIVKGVAYSLLAAVLGYCFYWLFFRNWTEERQVRNFLTTVQEQRFEDAYEFWDCSVSEPCRDYLFEEFLEDWGPESPLGAIRSYELGRSYTQPNGAIIEVIINGEKQPNFWVEESTKVISYFPY
jgi:hypothetical protein